MNNTKHIEEETLRQTELFLDKCYYLLVYYLQTTHAGVLADFLEEYRQEYDEFCKELREKEGD